MIAQAPSPPPRMPYMVGLNFPYLRKLINDPIAHDLAWCAMPTKLHSDIPKFKGQVGEYLDNCIMYFHIWCSSNSIIEDSVWLASFNEPLQDPLFVNEPIVTYDTFEGIAKAFLLFFQIPI